MRLALPRISNVSSPSRKLPRRPAQLFETPWVTHEVALLLVLEDPLGFGEQSPVHPGRHCPPDVDVRLNGHQLALAWKLSLHLRIDRRRVHVPVDAHLPQAERLDHLEGERACTEAPGLAVRAGRVMDGTRAQHVVHAPIGEGHVDLNVVGLPLVRHRLDPDARQADLEIVIPYPGIHRLAHLSLVGLRGPDEAELVVEAAGQIDRHSFLRVRDLLADRLARFWSERAGSGRSAGSRHDALGQSRDDPPVHMVQTDETSPVRSAPAPAGLRAVTGRARTRCRSPRTSSSWCRASSS